MCVTCKVVFREIEIWCVKELLELFSLLILPNVCPGVSLLSSLMVTQ